MNKMQTILGGMTVCLLLAGCTTTQQGAVAGGLIGAGTGAIIGNQTGHAGNGALIGAGVGALSGALVGDAIEHSPAPPATRYYSPGPPPPPSAVGYYQTRVVTGPTGEHYEERVWIPR